MAKYELALVVNAKIEKEERIAVVKKADAYIERFEGKLGATTEWGKKRLAYEIQHMKEGFYYFIPFTGDSETPNELESQLRIMEPVIRYLVVKPEAETEAPVAEEAAPAEEKAE